jgi:hypothetical protein
MASIEGIGFRISNVKHIEAMDFYGCDRVAALLGGFHHFLFEVSGQGAAAVLWIDVELNWEGRRRLL